MSQYLQEVRKEPSGEKGKKGHLCVKAGTGHSWEGGRTRLSFDLDILFALCSLHQIFLILDIFSLSYHYFCSNRFSALIVKVLLHSI